MKNNRLITLTMTVVLCLSLFLPSVFAAESTITNTVISSTRIELDNGDYIIEEIGENEDTQILRASSSKSGYKKSTYYNSSDVAIFSVQVNGSFTYNGTTAKATSSSATVYIHNESATYVSKSTNYSSNFATATGKVKYLGITIPKTVTLYCSAAGVLS